MLRNEFAVYEPLHVRPHVINWTSEQQFGHKNPKTFTYIIHGVFDQNISALSPKLYELAAQK